MTKKKTKKNKLKEVIKLLNFNLNFKLYLYLIFLVLSLLLFFSIYNFYSILELKEGVEHNLSFVSEIKNDEDKGLVKYLESETDNTRDYSRKYGISSFGDNFSNSFYLNLEDTNMFLDEIITALTFQPRYEFKKIKDCQSVNTCLPISDIEIPSIVKACLEGECLEIRGNSLYFKNKKIALPSELSRENILRMSVGKLETKWLLGVVVGESYDEAGLVFEFNGISFSTLISRETKYRISPKYNRLGSYIGFGGEDDNFLIVYGGYHGIAYQFKDNNFYNLSQFFGFRVTNPSFIPQVVKTKEGNYSTWYVGSLTASKPKIIKLWQNGSETIKGALDFSDLVFTDNNLREGISYIFLPFEKEKSLHVISDGSLYVFSDLGFDNSHIYQAVSKNIYSRKQGNVPSAVAKDLQVSSKQKESDYISNFSSSDEISIYLANREGKWEEVNYRENYYFSKKQGDGLYWKLVFKNNLEDNYFSPWFDSFNKLNYSFIN